MVDIIGLGDSIMAGVRSGVVEADTFLYKIANARGATYLNKGVANDTSAGMLSRFSADVLASSPKHLFLMPGENDYNVGSLTPAQFESNLRSMIEQALHNNIRVTLATPPLSTDSAYVLHVPDYNAVTRKLAKIYGLDFVDVWARFAGYSVNPGGSTYTNYLLDAYHPSPAGCTAIADLFSLPEYEDFLAIPASSISSTWVVAAGPVTTPYESTGWSGYTIVQRIEAAQISHTGLTDVRVTFRAGTSEGLSIASAYIGHAAASGDAYDFESTPTQILFGGSASGSTTTPSTEFSAEAAFSIQASKALLVAFYCNDSSKDAGAQSQSQTGWQAYWKNASDAATVNKAGYTAGNKIDMVVKIETK